MQNKKREDALGGLIYLTLSTKSGLACFGYLSNNKYEPITAVWLTFSPAGPGGPGGPGGPWRKTGRIKEMSTKLCCMTCVRLN